MTKRMLLYRAKSHKQPSQVIGTLPHPDDQRGEELYFSPGGMFINTPGSVEIDENWQHTDVSGLPYEEPDYLMIYNRSYEFNEKGELPDVRTISARDAEKIMMIRRQIATLLTQEELLTKQLFDKGKVVNKKQASKWTKENHQ